jgi:hypothetical protein
MPDSVGFVTEAERIVLPLGILLGKIDELECHDDSLDMRSAMG